LPKCKKNDIMSIMKIELEKLEKSELIEIILIQMAQVEALTKRVAELEAQLNQNSTNSSKPPSTDWKQGKILRGSSGANPGGQPGHKGNFLKIEREADEIVNMKPSRCAKCGKELHGTEGSVKEQRNKIDVEIRTKITRYEQVEVECPCCNSINREEFPAEVKSHVSYGEGVQSIGVLLTSYANVSIGKTQKIMNDVLEVPISTGTLVNHTKEFAGKSKPILKEIADCVKSGETANFDETSVRVNGKNYWMHTAGNSEATYNTVHESRGTAGTDDNGVLKEFKGVAVHDCLPQYFKYGNCTHAVCNAHLVRELQGVIDNTGQVWAANMQTLLRDTKKSVDEHKTDGQIALPDNLLQSFASEYDRIIALGEIESPRNPDTRKQSKSRNLLERFIEYRTEIIRFADNFDVPFTNNQAERDIRNAKIKVKVAGCFRSVDGAKNFGKISSVIGTATKQSKSAFKTIGDIFNGSLVSIFRKPKLQQ